MENVLATLDDNKDSNENFSEDSVNKNDDSTVALAELNFIAQYFEKHPTEGLIDELRRFKGLINSRTFVTKKGIAAVKEEEDDVCKSYRWEYRRSCEPITPHILKGVILLILGLGIAGVGAFLLWLSGFSIWKLLILLVGLGLLGLIGEEKDDIAGIREAQRVVDEAREIAKIKDDSIEFKK